MRLQTKYITADDFFQYFGIDLGAKLKGDANPSDKANSFLLRIENDIASWLDYTFFQDVDSRWPEFTDTQKEEYQLALLEQAMYVFRNGDIGVDSGYEPDEGIKVSKKEIKDIMIAPKAEMHLNKAGLCSRYLEGYGGRGIWVL